MEDFNSKYTGKQVEDLLDQVANGEVGGGTTNVQADWNVSDTTSDSYIKNRTHYAEFSQVSIPTTINTNSWTEIKLSGIAGQTLYVKYSYPPSNIAAATTLSMNDLGVERTFNNGPTFRIYRSTSSIYIKGFYDENHTLEVTTVVHKLPEYFIPLNIARTSELSGKQDTLISGENIKTINGESILGSGDITISGGGDVVNTPKYIQWNSTGMYFSGATTMTPNVKYVCTSPLSAIHLDEMLMPEDSWHGGVTDLYNEFTIIFESNETEIRTPDSFIWANGAMPTIENGIRYELSIALMYINNNYIAHAVLTPFKSI